MKLYNKFYHIRCFLSIVTAFLYVNTVKISAEKFYRSDKFVFAGCACTHFAPLYCLDDNNHSALLDKQKTKHPHKTKRSATVGSLERRFVLLTEFLTNAKVQDLKECEIK